MALPGIANVLTADEVSSQAMRASPRIRRSAQQRSSYFAGRSGDIFMIPKENWLLAPTATTHGTLYPYDQRVPVIFYGATINPGPRDDAATPADVAVTLGVDHRREASLSGWTGSQGSAPLIRAEPLARASPACASCCGWRCSSPSLRPHRPSGSSATISPTSTRELREWDTETAAMLRTGELRVRQTRADTLLPGRVTRRARSVLQRHPRLRRQCRAPATARRDARVFGQRVHRHRPGTVPAVAEDQARARIAVLAGVGPPATSGRS